MLKRSIDLSDRRKWLEIINRLFVFFEIHLQIEGLFNSFLGFILICWPKDVRPIPEIIAEFVLGMAFPNNMTQVLTFT